MEVDNAILPDWVSKCLQENEKMMEQISEEVISLDGHPIILQDNNYDRGGKILRIERAHVCNKNVVDRAEINVDLSRVTTSGLMKLHLTNVEALVESIRRRQVKNMNLKEKIKELENALSRGPLLKTSLEIHGSPLEISSPYASHNFDKAINILNTVKSYMVGNICERL